MESLLNVVENVDGDCVRADDAEQHVIDELRQMGNDALHSWADKAVVKSSNELKEKETKLEKYCKKKSTGIPLLEI